MEISHLHKYSDPLLSALLKHLASDYYSLKSSLVWHYKLGTPIFGEFLPLSSGDPLKLCQVGWGASLNSRFQVSLEMFDRVQVRALAGSHSCIVLAVFKGSLSCWKVNLRPSLRSWALWSRFSSRISLYFAPSFLRSWLVSQSLPLKNIPTAWCCHHHASP